MGNVNGIYGNHYDETHCYIVPAKDSTLLASHEAQIAIYRQLQKAVDNHQRGETFNTSIQLIEHAPLLPYHRRVFPASHTTAKQEGASAIAIQEPQYICERDPHDHAYIVYPPQYAGKNASTHLNLR